MTSVASALTPDLTAALAARTRATATSTREGETATRTPVPNDIREAADGFESLFVMQLLEPLEKSGQALFGDGPEGRTVGGLYREQLSQQIAASRPIGVADLIEKELLARRAAGIVDTAASGAAASNPSPSIAAVAPERAADLYRKATS